MKTRMKTALLGACALISIGLQAAEATKQPAPKPAAASTQLFPDDVLCKGKGVEIKRSELDEAFLQFKANLNARGQTLPQDRRELVESQLLDRLVVTHLLLGQATDEDRKKARTAADKFVASTKEQAGSEESFSRQLGAMNFTPAQFDAQVLERAVCEEVVDRELKSKVSVTDEQIKKYYEENGQQFERPETVRAAHILLSTRDPITNQELSEEKKKEKKQQMEKILERVRKGEDFAALAKEFSDDPGSKNKGGEYTFGRGQMMPEFESTAFSLKTNQVSDVVTTSFGFHIIKLHERIPAQKLELAKVKDDLKEQLSRFEVQEKMLPEFLKKLKQNATLEYLNGGKPPAEVPAETPPEKPADKPVAPEKKQ
jgi:peptidyl-prolyl cis-trans isomerase C